MKPNRFSSRLALGTCLGALLIGLLSACNKAPAPAAPGGDAAPSTLQANAAVAKAYDLNDASSMADAKRGFIAAPSGKITDSQGKVLWDFDSFAFVQGEAPTTVNPSLWREAKLNNQIGLFKVKEGIYQLRGFDIANITLIEGKTGWIVVDALTGRETAAAAMAFARQHLGNKPVSALIFSHSHIDHFGGALGVISAEDAAARHIPIVAPEGFMEEATSENLMVGIAMGRRASYMYGSDLGRSPKGAIDTGNGKAVALGAVGILAPTLTIHNGEQAETIDGVRFEFHGAPGSEAPSEMTFNIPELKAYCGAEVAVQTMHNLYTLRGTKVRDALKWSEYLDRMVSDSASAEVYFAQHQWPVWGHDNIARFLSMHRDVYRYTHDQTVRMINAGNAAAKQLLARAYDQLGYMAESAPWRNEYLSGARDLREGPPKQGATAAVLLDMLQHTSIDHFLDAMAASLNGPKAEGVTLKVNLVFSDVKQSYVLDLNNAVLHHHSMPPATDANATLTLTKPLFLKMLTGTAGVKDTLLSDDLHIDGSKLDLVRFFSLIDKAQGNFAIATR